MLYSLKLDIRFMWVTWGYKFFCCCNPPPHIYLNHPAPRYVTFRNSSLGAYYKHRRIPICELYELYIEDKVDFNQDCEEGDCFKILSYHR